MYKVYLIMIISLLAIKEVDAQTVIIANKSVPVDSISKSMLKDIYTMQIRKWRDGTKICLFNIKEKSELKTNFFNCIGRNISELRKLWMRLELTGEVKAPEAVKTQEEVVKHVANKPGAIGYTDLESVTTEVKVILICK